MTHYSTESLYIWFSSAGMIGMCHCAQVYVMCFKVVVIICWLIGFFFFLKIVDFFVCFEIGSYNIGLPGQELVAVLLSQTLR